MVNEQDKKRINARRRRWCKTEYGRLCTLNSQKRYLEKNPWVIAFICNGTRKTAGGFKWKFMESVEESRKRALDQLRDSGVLMATLNEKKIKITQGQGTLL